MPKVKWTHGIRKTMLSHIGLNVTGPYVQWPERNLFVQIKTTDWLHCVVLWRSVDKFNSKSRLFDICQFKMKCKIESKVCLWNRVWFSIEIALISDSYCVIVKSKELHHCRFLLICMRSLLPCNLRSGTKSMSILRVSLVIIFHLVAQDALTVNCAIHTLLKVTWDLDLPVGISKCPIPLLQPVDFYYRFIQQEGSKQNHQHLSQNLMMIGCKTNSDPLHLYWGNNKIHS